MADIAELGYKVDSRDLERSERVLDQQARSAKKAETASQRLERQYKRTIKQAEALGKVLGVVGLALAYGVIRNTIEAEKVQAQLAAALKSTAGASGQTIKSLNEHAGALQRVTAYGDEAIGTAQGVLLTFTKIGGDTFPKTTEAVLDMATALQMDLKSAAIQVGKALNDPLLGVSMLGRAGVTFSQDQKAMIKSLVETGDLAGAQVVILKELETQFGGSARAARDTLGGALESLKNAFGDLLEGDTGGDGIRGTKGAIEDLTAVLQSSSTKQAFNSIIESVASLTAELVEGVSIWANYLAKAAEMRALATGNATSANTGTSALNERLAQVAERRRELQDRGTVRSMLGGTQPGWLIDAFGEDAGAQAARERAGGFNPYTQQGELAFLEQESARLIREIAAGNRRDLANESGGSSGSPNGRGRGFRNVPPMTPATEATVETTERQTAATRALSEAERELEEQRRLMEQQQMIAEQAFEDYTRSMEDLRAEMGGPLAQVQLEYIRREDELIRLAQLAGLSQEELAQSLGILEAARLRDVEAIQAQIDAQKEYEQRLKDQPLIDQMDALRDTTQGFFVDLVKNGQDAVDRLADYLFTSALQGIGKMIAEQLFGAMGTTGGGMFGGDGGGGGWAAALGALFGGGRAYGGNVRGDKIYEFGEGNRPEMAHIGGKNYLLPGNQGRVEPMESNRQRPAPASRGGDTIIIQGATTKRAIQRIQMERDRQQRNATRTYG